jgi:NTE family protein
MSPRLRSRRKKILKSCGSRELAISKKGKVGLVLGGGAARGLAHIGVLEVLDKEGIPVDMIAGTSAGAAVGALYAQGSEGSRISEAAAEMNWRKWTALIDLALPKNGFIRGRKIKNLLKSIIGDVEFSGLKIPLACVATDINTGAEVVIEQGSVLDGVRASISVPVIFTVVKWKGRYLVDGGLVNPVPVDVVKRMGADFTIAVNVTADVVERIDRRKKGRAKGIKEPNIFDVLMSSLYITTYALVKPSLEAADIVIEPDMPNIGYGDFHQVQECIRRGRLAARSSIPEIKKQLGI